MPTLTIANSGLQNFTVNPLSNQVTGKNISAIDFTNVAATTASFNTTQFGGTNISNSVVIDGSASSNAITVAMTAGGTFSAAGWTFTNWSKGQDTITLTATGTGNFNLAGSRRDDVINASADGNNTLEGGFGSDTLNGSSGNDTFLIRFPNQIDPYEVMSGAGGTDRIALSTTSAGDARFDFRSHGITSVEVLDFMSPFGGAHAAWFTSSQFGGGNLSSALKIDGMDADDFLNIFIDSAVMDASDFSMVTGAGSIHFNGTGYAEWIIGSEVRDRFVSRGGKDTLMGGGGDDSFVYFISDDVAAETYISGGDGIDELSVGISGDDFDFTQATLSSVERVTFGAGGNAAKFSSSQFGVGLSNTLELLGGSGSDVLRVSLQSNSFSAKDWKVTGFGVDDRIELTGNNANNTIIGSSGNDFLFGKGGRDMLTGGAGADTFLLVRSDLAGGANDTITDYNSGEGDVLVVKGGTLAEMALTGSGLTRSFNMGSATNALTMTQAGNVTVQWYASENATTLANGAVRNYDAAGLGEWAEYTQQYDSQNRFDYESGVYDGGWRAGGSWTTDVDQAGDQYFVSYRTEYNSAGQAYQQFGLTDDGRSWEFVIAANGVTTTQAWGDQNATRDWSGYIDFYDTFGRLDYEIGTYDAGWRAGGTWSYDQDQNNDSSFVDWYRNEYNAVGQLYQQFGYTDDGRAWELWYDNANVNTFQRWNDVANNHSFSYYTDTLGDYGNGLTWHRVGLNDNGSAIDLYY